MPRSTAPVLRALLLLLPLLSACESGPVAPTLSAPTALARPPIVPLEYRYVVTVDGAFGTFTALARTASGTALDYHLRRLGLMEKLPSRGLLDQLIPGRVKWGEVTLTDLQLEASQVPWRWREEVLLGNIDRARADVRLIVYDETGAPIAVFGFGRAWPSRVTEPEDGLTHIDQLIFQHEWMTVDLAPPI